MKLDSLKVCVRCYTFNHVTYITDTLNGFCAQQTDFPFVCAIVDDASTDGEQEVIKKYIEDNFVLGDKSEYRYEETDDFILTFARHRSNSHCYFAVLYLKYNHYSIKKQKIPYISEWYCSAKYIALCEGDDFWIDPSKLQKQVNALEANPNAVLSYTGFLTIDEKGNQISQTTYDGYMSRSHSGDNLLELFKGNYIMTMTTMCRAEIPFSDIYQNCPSQFDYTLALTAALKGMFIYLPDVTACYRITSTGAMGRRREQVNKGNYIAYKYFSRLILSGKYRKMSFGSRLKILAHILVHSFVMGDKDFVHECARMDWLSCALLPFAFVYSIIKKKLTLELRYE